MVLCFCFALLDRFHNFEHNFECNQINLVQRIFLVMSNTFLWHLDDQQAKIHDSSTTSMEYAFLVHIKVIQVLDFEIKLLQLSSFHILFVNCVLIFLLFQRVFYQLLCICICLWRMDCILIQVWVPLLLLEPHIVDLVLHFNTFLIKFFICPIYFVSQGLT